jgi:mRNA-degrading endonuclease RelE of RelBE toxin-antitoxin system
LGLIDFAEIELEVVALLPGRFNRKARRKKSGDNQWHVCVGDYRIVYEIDDTAKIVDVTQIAHRREVYL